MMTKKQLALEHIRVECYEKGEITSLAIRIYCENRISRAAFDKACRKGLAQRKGARTSWAPTPR